MSRVLVVAAVLSILAVGVLCQDTLPPNFQELASQPLNSYATVTKIQTRILPTSPNNFSICVGVQFQTSKLEIWTGSLNDGVLDIISAAEVDSNVLDFSFLDRGYVDCETVLLTTSGTLSFGPPFENFSTAVSSISPTKIAYSMVDYDVVSSMRMLFFVNGTGGFTVMDSNFQVKYSYVNSFVGYNSVSVANFAFDSFAAILGVEGSAPPAQAQKLLGSPTWSTNGATSTGARRPQYTTMPATGLTVHCYDNGALLAKDSRIYCGSSFLDTDVAVSEVGAGGTFFHVSASPVQDNVIAITAGVAGSSPKFKLVTVDLNMNVIDQWNGFPLSTASPVSVGSHAADNKIAIAYCDDSGGVTLRIYNYGYVAPPIVTPPVPDTPLAGPVTSPQPSQPSSNPSSGGLAPSDVGSPTAGPDSISPSGNTPNTGPGSVPTRPGTNTTDSLFTTPNGDLNDNGIGLVVGLVVGGAALATGAFLLVFFMKKKQKKKKPDEVPMANTPGADEPTYGNIPSFGGDKYSMMSGTAAPDDGIIPGNIQPSEIDKRLHIPHKSLVFVKEIGAGSYGKVHLGEWRGAKVAIKVNNTITDVDGFLAEAKLTLGIPPHPNLVQTFGVSLDGPNPCIVLEYCGGGSLDQFQSEKGLNNEKRIDYALKIAYGLLHLHSRSIVHRDLAARNILLTNDGSPKISDFGMSRIVQEEAAKGRTKTNVGPIRWMAPESLKDRSYSLKTDVWTFGIMLFEMVTGKEPHEDEDQFEIALKIRDQGYTPQIPEDCDPILREVMEMCWKKSPAERPSMEEVCDFMRSKVAPQE